MIGSRLKLARAAAGLSLRQLEDALDSLVTAQVSGAEISPDGRQVIYTKSELKKWSDNKRVSSVWIANTDGTDHRQLLGHDRDRSPSWSPDGRQIAFLSTRDQAEGARDAAGAQIWLLRTSGGEANKLTEHKTAIRAIKWSDDSSRIFFTAEEEDPSKDTRKNRIGDGIVVDEGPNGQGRGSYSNVWTIGLTDKQARRLTTGDNFIGDFQPSPDGKAVTYVAPSDKTWELAQGNLYIHPLEGGGRPTLLSSKFQGEIAVVDAAGKTTAVTDVNAWFKQVQTSQMRPMTWKSKDGLEIEGLRWLPASYQTGDKLPLILSIHGGPAGVWSTSFRGINHVYTSLGWAVLEPNVRGSTSYGDPLLRGNMKDIGGWTITQTQRVKAASLGAMVSDWASEYARGFNHDVRLWYIGGTPWDNPEGYRKQSSYTFIGKVATPTLLLHGEQDETCTIGQSMMFYQGLKDRGVSSRFIRFPREPHGFREPHHIRRRDAEEISWLMKHTRGLDWKADTRKDDETNKPATTTTATP